MQGLITKPLSLLFITAFFAACGQKNSNSSIENETSQTAENESPQTEITIETVFLDNDTTKNRYTILHPTTSSLKGYVFLLPGLGETAERVMQQTSLPEQLAQHGLLTIIPTLQDGVLSFGIDDSSQFHFSKIVADVREKNNLTNEPFYLGGYSIGGSCVLKYAEETHQKPNAIFVIDPPVDFEQLYNSSKRNLRLLANEPPNEENIYIIQRLEEIMQGSPEKSIKNYHRISPYSYSDTSQTAIKKLLGIPLRIYTEPDIHWWMKEHGEDYTGMNSTFHSAMINELNLLGNKDAVLITTVNKGFREPDQERHPHSWSIVDNAELISWLLEHR